jgi:hypothetical protein
MYRAPTRARSGFLAALGITNWWRYAAPRIAAGACRDGWLVLGEGFHGGDAGGALRGEQAGGEADSSHYARGAGEDWQVERLYVEEDGVHGATGLPCAEQA